MAESDIPAPCPSPGLELGDRRWRPVPSLECGCCGAPPEVLTAGAAGELFEDDELRCPACGARASVLGGVDGTKWDSEWTPLPFVARLLDKLDAVSEVCRLLPPPLPGDATPWGLHSRVLQLMERPDPSTASTRSSLRDVDVAAGLRAIIEDLEHLPKMDRNVAAVVAWLADVEARFAAEGPAITVRHRYFEIRSLVAEVAESLEKLTALQDLQYEARSELARLHLFCEAWCGPACAVCGCTTNLGCIEGCHWVAESLCSRCVGAPAHAILELGLAAGLVEPPVAALPAADPTTGASA